MTITAKNVTVSVCLKELPFDVSICNITDSNDREILDKYYNVKVTNGTINEKVGKENKKVNQIDAYGMVDNQIVKGEEVKIMYLPNLMRGEIDERK